VTTETATRPLAEFLDDPEAHVARLKASRRPEVLTVDGQAELVVLDPETFREMIERIDAPRNGSGTPDPAQPRFGSQLPPEMEVRYGGERGLLAPGVESTPAVCGGDPVLAGTRFPIHILVQHLRHAGGSIDRVLCSFPDLTRSQVEQGLAYYEQQREELDALARRDRDSYDEGLAAQRVRTRG
jgi:uncharacterized protein (DUF433 family)